jgi:hypothetical protein
MRKYFKYFIIFLSLNFPFNTQVLSAECATVSGTTVVILTSCDDLVIGVDNSNVTINTGVTISASSDQSYYHAMKNESSGVPNGNNILQ